MLKEFKKLASPTDLSNTKLLREGKFSQIVYRDCTDRFYISLYKQLYYSQKLSDMKKDRGNLIEISDGIYSKIKLQHIIKEKNLKIV